MPNFKEVIVVILLFYFVLLYHLISKSESETICYLRGCDL